MNFNWNPVFNLVMEIKYKFFQKYNKQKEEDISKSKNFKFWVEFLGVKEYSDFIDNVIINQQSNLILIKAITEKVQDDLWNNEKSIYRECRSMIIDLENDNLVLAPFAKIFNLDEASEVSKERIKKEIKSAKLFEVTNKLDGTLQSARFYNNRIIMNDSLYFDPLELPRLADGYSKLVDNYKNLICENTDYTFSFENISESDPHFVNYNSNEEGLYLIGMRDIRDGRQLPYKEISLYANKYNIPMPAFEDKALEVLLTEGKEVRVIDKEGWVINISLDGYNSKLVKIKVDDYLNIPNSFEEIVSINTIIRFFDKFDDFICKIPLAVRNECIYKYKELIKIKEILHNHIDSHYEKSPKKNITSYMEWVNENVPDYLKEHLKNKYIGNKINVFADIEVIKKLYNKEPIY